jgi:hypothetical protein
MSRLTEIGIGANGLEAGNLYTQIFLAVIQTILWKQQTESAMKSSNFRVIQRDF